MFIKLDIVDNQPILTNFIDLRNDDVTVDRFQLEFGIIRHFEFHI